LKISLRKRDEELFQHFEKAGERIQQLERQIEFRDMLIKNMECLIDDNSKIMFKQQIELRNLGMIDFTKSP
jgi:hypothetical protein